MTKCECSKKTTKQDSFNNKIGLKKLSPGIPYNDAESQGTFWVNLGDFASSLENLQLQRGVGTSTNGSGAFGASLNILTDAISEHSGGEIANSLGSFGTRKHSVKFTTGLINEHFEFAGRLSKIYSDGYVDRAFTDLKSYYLQGNYMDDNTLVKAITFGGKEKTYQSWYGLSKEQMEQDRTQNPYTYDNETDNYWQNHYQLHWNETLNSNWSTNLGLNYTRGKGFFEQFKDDRDAADYNNLINDGSDVIVRRWLDNHFYVLNANTTYQKNGLEIISGISYSDYTNDHYGELIWGSDLVLGTSIRDRYYLSNNILKAMNRQHTREEYFELIDNIKTLLPDCTISHDIICGFPTESEEDHKDTLSLMEYVKYSFGYMFAYSERPGTLAERKMKDDIPEEVKKRRLSEVVELQQKHSLYRSQEFLNQVTEVLIEKTSKKSDAEWSGRNPQNTTVVFPKENYKVGDFVMVKIEDCTSATLKGKAIGYSKNM